MKIRCQIGADDAFEVIVKDDEQDPPIYAIEKISYCEIDEMRKDPYWQLRRGVGMVRDLLSTLDSRKRNRAEIGIRARKKTDVAGGVVVAILREGAPDGSDVVSINTNGTVEAGLSWSDCEYSP